jgi:nitrogen fixation protein NifU and related proteins
MPYSTELYQQVILEHNNKPRNFKVLETANYYAVGKNPLCGDELAVYLYINDQGFIEDVGFQGSGCAIAKASASLMTTQIKGKTLAEAQQLKHEFQAMVTDELDITTSTHHLGKLTLFEGVKQYPVRIKCATLAWHAMDAALLSKEEPVSTEA